MKKIFVDKKIREIEYELLSDLGYEIVLVETNNNLYDEISSHTDIMIAKVCNDIIIEPTLYEKMNVVSDNYMKGISYVDMKYPEDVSYNVCQIGNNVVHNFSYTDKKVLEMIEKNNLNKIDVKQGYSNCSIAVIDDAHVITQDKAIADKLADIGINVLLIENVNNIRLKLNDGSFSKMHGFIGGCTAKIDNKFIIFGDLNKIDVDNKIRNFINSIIDIELIEFPSLDVVDYGGIIID